MTGPVSDPPPSGPKAIGPYPPPSPPSPPPVPIPIPPPLPRGCDARAFIPAGVHVSPTHLSANENHHVCDGHDLDFPDYHRCRCGTSFVASREPADV